MRREERGGVACARGLEFYVRVCCSCELFASSSIKSRCCMTDNLESTTMNGRATSAINAASRDGVSFSIRPRARGTQTNTLIDFGFCVRHLDLDYMTKVSPHESKTTPRNENRARHSSTYTRGKTILYISKYAFRVSVFRQFIRSTRHVSAAHAREI